MSTSKLLEVPEMTYPHEPKIRTMRDGTRKHYAGGFLHRDPYEGPAVEKPGKNDVSDCYVRGILVDQKWYMGKLFASMDEVVQFQKENGESEGTKPVLNGHGSLKSTNKNLGFVPEKKVPAYLPDPVQAAKPKKRDRFDKLADRVKGSGMQELQKLYAELSAGKTESVTEARTNGF